jgi:hypothetical protein
VSSNPRTFARSFAGGEVTPEFFGRIDDAKFQTGLSTCRNFIVKPHGPVENRPGLAVVREVKDSTKKTRILPFIYASDQSVVVEVGAGYFRFHTQGATLLAPAATAYDNAHAYVQGDLASSGGVTYYCIAATTGHAPPNATYWYALPSTLYELPNPYAEGDLATIRLTQSNDVLTLTHPNYPPAELRRNGATDWTYTVISFVSRLTQPTGVSATAHPATTSPGTPTLQSYVVTAVNGPEESPASSEV